MANKNPKIVPVRKNNLISIIFGAIMIYLIAIFIIYISKEKIKIYEVVQGSLSGNTTYTGLILREETVVTSEYTGYVKCYLQNGEKARKGKPVYGIDETGETLQTDNSSGLHTSNITQEDLDRLNKYLNNFKYNYDGQNFETVYNFKYQMQTALNELVIDSLEGELENTDAIKVSSAEESGLILFRYDGYEGLKESDITSEFFDSSQVSGNYVPTGKLVQQGDIIYTLVSGQDWSIVIPADEEFIEKYDSQNSMTIRLKTLDTSVNADMEIFQGADQQSYVKFTIQDYMSAYINDRFISIELEEDKADGLKVPKSSVVSKDFFIIPSSYVTAKNQEDAEETSNNNQNEEMGVYIDNAAEDGSEVVFVTPTIYSKDEEYYYVDDAILQSGMHILLDGNEDYVVGEKKALQGVYNVNKGYAVFEQVEILDENEEYYIVKGSSAYGLVTFDHIVLNAATMNEDDLLY